MNIVFRADASPEIGTGHVMRCLTLAGRLHKSGHTITFVCGMMTEGLKRRIVDSGYSCYEISGGIDNNTDSYIQDAQGTIDLLKALDLRADCLIVDHYGIDEKWERLVKPNLRKLMVIDDLANRRHQCDILLDQNFYLDMQARYLNLVPPDCALFLGPEYALLRPEFTQLAEEARRRDGSVKRILVSFGGSDPTNETEKVLRALKKVNGGNFQTDVAMGAASPHLERIKDMCREMGVHLHIQVDYIAQLMQIADLGIGSGGTTTWERMMMGLPSLTIIVAENQRQITEDLAHIGAVINLGRHSEVTDYDIAREVTEMIEHPDRLLRVGEFAAQGILKVGNGVDRLIKALNGG
ncbi:UDP-2,4-diacetamido-2,4,6-trideoxy-beta-L-altropyranose hydrolase [Paenibacillus abyssi]|uniref:UDP-2,4-diacetamido-2,4, 6-trideoxy-beta-L-altropyranose hydrolase n=1 Tax=Paenibacillus abyssi TaxID=1340531 RepID=A0A917FNE4_9BACL|nr:UDP-2,4-diacetamido-2,4,6-trideoxy-beta-L-altropyranose hydrolase [Paenibacillus abyssi]GGF91421.1 UDP-2,4-diacetamido-2,4,6-trideoxy-beta-L-altropyranose hydrolase [Paenibacillus abyssi]